MSEASSEEQKVKRKRNYNPEKAKRTRMRKKLVEKNSPYIEELMEGLWDDQRYLDQVLKKIRDKVRAKMEQRGGQETGNRLTSPESKTIALDNY
jgi:hypothetical protein